MTLVDLSASQSVSEKCWSDVESDGDSDSENIIYGAQVYIKCIHHMHFNQFNMNFASIDLADYMEFGFMQVIVHLSQNANTHIIPFIRKKSTCKQNSTKTSW